MQTENSITEATFIPCGSLGGAGQYHTVNRTFIFSKFQSQKGGKLPVWLFGEKKFNFSTCSQYNLIILTEHTQYIERTPAPCRYNHCTKIKDPPDREISPRYLSWIPNCIEKYSVVECNIVKCIAIQYRTDEFTKILHMKSGVYPCRPRNTQDSSPLRSLTQFDKKWEIFELKFAELQKSINYMLIFKTDPIWACLQ